MTGEAGNAFVREKNGRFIIDRRTKIGSILTNEMILSSLVGFLRQYYPGSGSGLLLDAGAGSQPYKPVYSKHFPVSVSFDLPGSLHDISNLDVISRSQRLPFRDQVFEFIVCTEMLEHVPDPVIVLQEFYRVLKPGGRIFLSTPFMLPLHEMPYDYYRFSPSALRWIAEKAQLTTVSVVSRGDWLAHLMLQCQYPILKTWQYLSARLGVDLVHPWNPLIFIPVVLPQLLYLRYWKRLHRKQNGSLFARLYRKLEYTSPGYISHLLRMDPSDENRKA